MKKLVCMLLWAGALTVLAQHGWGTIVLGVPEAPYKNLQLYPILNLSPYQPQTHRYLPLATAIRNNAVQIAERGGESAAPVQNVFIPNAENEDWTRSRRNQPIDLRERNGANTVFGRRRNAREQAQVQDSADITLQIQQVQQVQQLQGGASVNELLFSNKSSDTLFLMAGEIVTGGRQDRMIAKDMLIPPGTDSVAVAVYCVEHGRWSYKGEEQQFKGYLCVASNAVRGEAMKGKGQNAVWESVDKLHAKSMVSSSTQAYAALVEHHETAGELQQYLKAFESPFSGDTIVVGLLAVSGDKVLACDIFANHQLFAQAYPSLLQAHAVDAIANGAAVSIDEAAVKEFWVSRTHKYPNMLDLPADAGKVFIRGGRLLHAVLY